MTSETAPAAPERQSEILRHRDVIRDRLAELIEPAQREILVFSPQLDPHYFNSSRVARAFASFAARHRHNRARVLIEDAAQVVRDNERMVELARRLSEFVELRQVGEQHRGRREMFVVVDGLHTLEQDDSTRAEVVARRHDRPAAGALNLRFREMWDQSEPITEIRTAGL